MAETCFDIWTDGACEPWKKGRKHGDSQTPRRRKSPQIETRTNAERMANPAYAEMRKRNAKSEAQRLREWRAQASPDELEAYRAKVRARKAAIAATERGRELIRATKKRAYERRVSFINAHKTACAVCGESEAACLQFHHADQSNKEKNVISLATASMKKIVDEISKCVVLCANCHMKVHAGLVECPK